MISPPACSNILRNRHQVPVFDQDGLQRHIERLDLQVQWRLLRGLKCDLERRTGDARQRLQYAPIAIGDDAALGVETIDHPPGIARQELLCRLQRWLEQMLRQDRATDKAI